MEQCPASWGRATARRYATSDLDAAAVIGAHGWRAGL
jgi:hypothetical protein